MEFGTKHLTMRPSPSYARDGMAGYGSDPERFAGVLGQPMFNFANDYKECGMDSFREMHQSEFSGEPDGYQEVDVSYFDTVAVISGGTSPTTARFRDYGIVQVHERHDEGLVHNHHWAASDAGGTNTHDDYAAIQSHERDDDGLVHSHCWAASGSFAGSKARFHFHSVQAHEWHDDGLVHNHDWAVSGN